MGKQINSLNGSLYPVALVALTNVPCAAGCCTINVYVRPGTTDANVLEQVVIGDEYRFLQDTPTFQPKAILDAGGNIGLASVLFALRYPKAQIIVVEPSVGNFKVLEMNTARYGNVKLERRALWPNNAHLRVSEVDKSTRGGQWSYEVKEVGRAESDVHGVNFELLMAKHDISSFDMVKIDIEGSEKAVFDDFRHPSTGALRHWVKHAQMVVAEAHDDIAPGALAAMETAMNARVESYVKSMSGELHIWNFS